MGGTEGKMIATGGAVLLTSLAGFLYYKYGRVRYQNGIPIIPSLPILGNSLEILSDPQHFALKKKEKYGEVFISNILFRDTYSLLSPEGYQWVLKGEGRYLRISSPEPWRKMLGPKSLAVVIGRSHKILRNLLTPAFSPRNLESYLPLIEDSIRKTLDRMLQEGGEGKKELEIYPFMKRYSFDIAVKVFLGMEPEEVSGNLLKNFSVWLEGLGGILPWELPFTAFGKAMKARKEIQKEVWETIVKAKKAKEEGREDFPFIQRLLEAKDEEGNKIDDEGLKDQLLVFLFAGHDTVAATSTSLISLLGSHPEHVEKLLEEINQAFPDLAEPLEFQTLVTLPYLDAFIKETLRLYSPVAGGFKETLEDVEFKEYSIPKGTKFMYDIHYSHRTFFDDPETFHPERFIKGEGEKGAEQFASSFIPFGQGVRMCIGFQLAKLEMKVFLVHLLRKCCVKSSQNKLVRFPVFYSSCFASLSPR